MKLTYTTEYFEKYKDVLYSKYERMCDFEYRLSILLPDFSNLDIPEEHRLKAIEVVTAMTAKRVADHSKEELKKKMRMIEEIKSGRASLGYISVTQEIRAMHDLVEGFEFSCYMLSLFIKKYGVQ